ncbi:MAG: penicillin-binding transpeptidase domain-containing protein [Christensenellales bacterium]
MHLLTLLLVMLFALVIAYFCYSVYFYGGRWVANPYNPRISSQKQHVIMGTLTDRDGTVLAYTDEDGQRRYNNSADTRKAVCQVVGDSGGKVSTGADTFHAQFLLGFRSSIFERLADAFTGTTQRGDDVRLTISERLSRYISEQFPKGKRGAVVVLNYKTNEILAMVSMPQFDPTNMDAALANESAGALINRATQGLYPPGSTFKIVTLASALENLPDLNDFAFDCTGYYPVGNYSVTDGSAHGVQSLSDAFAHSCNTTFAALSQDLGYEMLGQTAEEMGFNENFMFSDLIVYDFQLSIDDLSAETGVVGHRQGARARHAAAHGAHRFDDCQPRRDERTAPHRASHDRAGRKPRAAQPCGRQARDQRRRRRQAGKRNDPRGEDQEQGKRAALDNGYTVAGKTGSAEASNDKSIESHAWFMGYITNDNAPYAVCVLVENGGDGGGVAAPLAPEGAAKSDSSGIIRIMKEVSGAIRRIHSGLMLLACLTLVSFSALTSAERR